MRNQLNQPNRPYSSIGQATALLFALCIALSVQSFAAEEGAAAPLASIAAKISHDAGASGAGADILKIDLRYNRHYGRGRLHGYRPFRHKRRQHPHNLRKLYPHRYSYPPRRYRYSCAYDRWGNSHPEFRRNCNGIGRHYYVPKNFYRKHRQYRGHPYMRRQLRNLRRHAY